jgi:hypothetical protein
MGFDPKIVIQSRDHGIDFGHGLNRDAIVLEIGKRPVENLRGLDAGHLIVAGIATNSVVSTTVAHAADIGYEVTVAEDACSSGNSDLHTACMENMKLIADVRTVDDIMRSHRIALIVTAVPSTAEI